MMLLVSMIATAVIHSCADVEMDSHRLRVLFMANIGAAIARAGMFLISVGAAGKD
jgi:hypothetical protein